MSVRAKFKVDSIKLMSYTTGYEKNADGKEDYSKPVKATMYSIEMDPVYGNGDPNHENTKFWKASPSGKVVLGTINEEAARQFELGSEYYIDFTKAGG